MYFAISLDAPQPPPYPSIWLDPPHVDFHWDSWAVLGNKLSNLALGIDAHQGWCVGSCWEQGDLDGFSVATVQFDFSLAFSL